MIFQFRGSKYTFIKFEKQHGTVFYVFEDERAAPVRIEYQSFFNMLKSNDLELM